MILDPEPCPKCGYNLQGLHRGGVCPECGRGISARKRGDRLRLIDAPRGYLQGLILTFLLMGWSGIAAFLIAGLPTVIFQLPILRVQGFVTKLVILSTVTGLVTSAGWALGALLLCRARPGFTAANPEPRHWVPYIRYTQPLWPLAFILLGVAHLTGVGAIFYVAYLCAFVAGLGVIPTAIHISEYADWADDLNLGLQIRTAGWMIGAGVIVDAVYRVAAAVDFLGLIVVLIVWIFALLVMLAGLFFISWRCIQMAGVVRWAIVNAKDADARNARIAEKAEAERQEQERRIAAQQRALGDQPPTETELDIPLETDPGPRAAAREQIVEESDDLPYKLEDP